MPKIINIKTYYNGKFVNETAHMTGKIEEQLIKLAIAVGFYVDAIVPGIRPEKIAAKVLEWLPEGKDWRSCVREYLEHFRPSTIPLLVQEGSFESEANFMTNPDARTAGIAEVAIPWRRLRAQDLALRAGANANAIEEVISLWFMKDLWWETVACELLIAGEKKTAEAILADPYYAVIREEQKLIKIVTEAADDTCAHQFGGWLDVYAMVSGEAERRNCQ